MSYPKTLVLDGVSIRLLRDVNSAAANFPHEPEFEYIYTAFWRTGTGLRLESEVFVCEPSEAELRTALRRSLKTGSGA